MVSNWDWVDPEHIFQEKNDGVAPHFKMQRAYVEAGTSRGRRPRERLGERWFTFFAMASPRFSYKIGVWRLAFGVCLIRDVEHETKNPRENKQGK